MSNLHLQYFIDLFASGNDLPDAEAEACFDALQKEDDEKLLASLLKEWVKKGSNADELHALASIMRTRAIKVRSMHNVFVDAVGTGGSIAKKFNISTAAAFVIAGAGLPVAKHGNRAATSSSGSADVLSELGVNILADADRAEECLNNIGICFMFAPKFHSLSPTLGKVRRELGVPTIFNNLGPLCNPAGAPHQIIGVWHKDRVMITAEALARLGTKRSWVVHGEDGLDEITLNGKTTVAEIVGGKVSEFDISPSDFGIEAAPLNGYSRLSPSESANLILKILSGERAGSPEESLVLMNAAAPLFLAGSVESLPIAFEKAEESIRSNSARSKLDELVRETKR